MKIKIDFITNSSSTCFIFDKQKLTEEEVEFLTGLTILHPIANYYRSSQCLDGDTLKKYVDNIVKEGEGVWLGNFGMMLLGYVLTIGADDIFVVIEGEDGGLDEDPIDGLLDKAKTRYPI